MKCFAPSENFPQMLIIAGVKFITVMHSSAFEECSETTISAECDDPCGYGGEKI